MTVLFGRQGTKLIHLRQCDIAHSARKFSTTERLFSTECVIKLHFCRIYLQPGHDMITVSYVIKLFVSRVYTLSYLPIDATSGI